MPRNDPPRARSTRARSTRLRRPPPNPEQAIILLGSTQERAEYAQATLPDLPDSDIEEIPEAIWNNTVVPFQVPENQRSVFDGTWPEVDPRTLTDSDEVSPSLFPVQLRQTCDDALSFEIDALPISQRIQMLVGVAQELDAEAQDLFERSSAFILLLVTLSDDGEYSIYSAELKKPSDSSYQLHEVLSNASQDLATDIGRTIADIQQDSAYAQYCIGTSETFLNLRSDNLLRDCDACKFVELPGDPAEIAGSSPSTVHLLSFATHDSALDRLLSQRNHREHQDTLLVYLYHRDLFQPLRDPSPPQSLQPHVAFQDTALNTAGPGVGTYAPSEDSIDAPAVTYIRTSYPEILSQIQRISNGPHSGPYMACQIITRVFAISEDLGMPSMLKRTFKGLSVLQDDEFITVTFQDIEIATGIVPLSRLATHRTFYNKVIFWRNSLKAVTSLPSQMAALLGAMELMLDRDEEHHVSTPSAGKYSVKGVATNTSFNQWKNEYFLQMKRYLEVKDFEGINNIII
ncbi:hypothetical protein DL96DRAFT_1711892 [Flagelloscypha sp. PMI_526]|nr:hypothetical protein DL96DRAFT_1711892 [Flagelloscypha sp. PMI_526]